ncbi:MAG: signal peptidase II [Balneolales bacterium]
MTSKKSKLTAFSLAAFVVVLLDQLSKYIIRTNPDLHNYEIIEGWLSFHYTLNPGMALGIDWADTWVISLIAIAATIVIIAFIFNTMNSARTGYMVCMGLIIGGALGNIIDRLFMARIEGYGTFLDGHVIDFIHFTLTLNGFRVFPYIFNVADTAISVSIIVLILFYKRLMPEYTKDQQTFDDTRKEEGRDEHAHDQKEEGPGTEKPRTNSSQDQRQEES